MDFKNKENKEKFLQFKSKTLTKIKNFLDSEIEADYKKSVLLIYWFNDYISYLKQEKTFNPVYFPIYDRGSVIQVDLGFNLGNEYGGLHYAIVLNRKDTKQNPVLTVVPISSIKKNKKWRIHDVNLSDTIFLAIQLKTETMVNTLEEQIRNSKNLDQSTINKFNQKIQEGKDCLEMAAKLNKGSFAICNQVTTIDKMRIKNPTKDTSPLYGIKIPEELLNEIANKLHKMYWQKAY